MFQINFQEVLLRFWGLHENISYCICKLQVNSSSFSPWHVHANMNFPYSSAFGCVTRCRTRIGSPQSTERRGDAYKYENGWARSLPSGGSKWLCRWATRINRRCGKADMRCFAYGHPSHISPARRWICPEEINGKTGAISFQSHRLGPFLLRQNFWTEEKV